MECFKLIRHEDETGISGIGEVAEGCIFQNGKVAMSWCSKKNPVSTVTIYENIDDVMTLHGHSGRTELVWVN